MFVSGKDQAKARPRPSVVVASCGVGAPVWAVLNPDCASPIALNVTGAPLTGTPGSVVTYTAIRPDLPTTICCMSPPGALTMRATTAGLSAYFTDCGASGFDSASTSCWSVH